MIRLAEESVAVVLRALIDDTRAFALRNASNVIESEPTQIDSHLISVRVARRNVRGARKALVAELFFDGKRTGFNAVVGKLEGRF